MAEPITAAQEARIIKRARRLGRIRNGVVLCDNCDTPADGPGSAAVKWNGCGACIWGEAGAIEFDDFVFVGGTNG